MNEIKKGSVVKYQSGYYRVSARYNKVVNLTGVFGSKPIFRKVPIEQVTEAHDEWYAAWQKSESYQSM